MYVIRPTYAKQCKCRIGSAYAKSNVQNSLACLSGIPVTLNKSQYGNYSLVDPTAYYNPRTCTV
jgi:hypothetical protein